jgi:hypothetical protein
MCTESAEKNFFSGVGKKIAKAAENVKAWFPGAPIQVYAGNNCGLHGAFFEIGNNYFTWK